MIRLKTAVLLASFASRRAFWPQQRARKRCQRLRQDLGNPTRKIGVGACNPLLASVTSCACLRALKLAIRTPKLKCRKSSKPAIGKRARPMLFNTASPPKRRRTSTPLAATRRRHYFSRDLPQPRYFACARRQSARCRAQSQGRRDVSPGAHRQTLPDQVRQRWPLLQRRGLRGD